MKFASILALSLLLTSPALASEVLNAPKDTTPAPTSTVTPTTSTAPAHPCYNCLPFPPGSFKIPSSSTHH